MFLASRDACCTVTNDTFMKYYGFKQIIIDTWRAAHFEHSSGVELLLPLTPKHSIYYLSLNIHAVTLSGKSQNWWSFKALALQPIATIHPSICGTVAHTLALHVAYGHCSVSVLQRMIDDRFITGRGVPKKLTPLPF